MLTFYNISIYLQVHIKGYRGWPLLSTFYPTFYPFIPISFIPFYPCTFSTKTGLANTVASLRSHPPCRSTLRRYTLAVIAAAETAADLAGVIRSNFETSEPDEVEPLDAIEFERVDRKS